MTLLRLSGRCAKSAQSTWENYEKLTTDDAKQALEDVLLPELELNFSEHLSLSIRAIELAQQYGLPATYDAHYLALAERKRCEYWTADTRLWNAIGGKLNWVRLLSD